MNVIFYFIAAFLFSLVLTFFAEKIFNKLNIVDRPDLNRKIHVKPIPFGGGLAIFLSFFGLLFFIFLFDSSLLNGLPKYFPLSIFLGGLIIVIGGFIDDKFDLKPRYQFIFPLISAVIFILGYDQNVNFFGLGNRFVFSNFINLGFIFFWLMSMMFTTKFLDGLDGLVGGIVAIGAGVLFALSNMELWLNKELSVLSIIFVGVCLGFLVRNFYPAKIFLGQGGSLFTGFLLGSITLLSGGKIATTFLVMGIPMLDVIRVVIKRWRRGQSIFLGDREHLHYRLVESGLSQKQAVLLLYTISFLFGTVTLLIQSGRQLQSLLFIFVLVMLLLIWFSNRNKNV